MKRLCCEERCCGLSRTRGVKTAYSCLMLGAMALYALALPFLASPQLWGCSQLQCVKERLAQLIFLAVAVMHLFLSASLLCKRGAVKILNQSLWVAKGLFIVAVAGLLFALTRTPIVAVLSLCKYTPTCFFLVVSMVYVDMIYALELLLKERGRKRAEVCKAIVVVIVLLAVATILAFSFKLLWVGITEAVVLGVTLLIALLRICPNNSLLICSLLSLYMGGVGFLLQQGLQALSVLSFFFVLFAMQCQGSGALSTPRASLNELLALNTSLQDQDDRYVSSWKWITYHFMMALLASSLPTLLNPIEELALPHFVWWVSLPFFYLWALVASKVFPKKDFSDLENYFKQFQLN